MFHKMHCWCMTVCNYIFSYIPILAKLLVKSDSTPNSLREELQDGPSGSMLQHSKQHLEYCWIPTQSISHGEQDEQRANWET